MNTLIYMVIGGLLGRLDGWGGHKYANVWVCGLLFAVATLILFGDFTAAMLCWTGFVLFRAPGFDEWQDWLKMYWRGFWPSAIFFTILSLYVVGHFGYGLLAFLMGAVEMLMYSGTFKYRVKYGDKRVHIIVELVTTAAFAGFTAIILNGA